ncbi:MAG: TRAP transporter substrate-binding protein DctP [Hyphomicrobiales bacterium]|nr:TRAP transporter substrate-binding protein DctP [Hyphomicrobiales bacterium]
MLSRRTFVKAGAVAAASSTVAAPFVISPARAQAVTLKMQGFLPSSAAPQKAFEKFGADVTAKSGGKLTIQVLPGGGAVAVTETLNAMQAGILDGHYTAPSFFAGRDAGFTVLGDQGPSFDTVDLRDRWFTEADGLAVARAQYAKFGVHMVAPVFWASEHIPARKALNGVEDLKGLKIRVPPGLIAEIIGKAGAAVVNLPGGEVFNALQSGVIDATDWASPALNQEVGLYRAAKFSVNAFHSMPTTDIAFAKSKWDALPADMKALIEAEAKAMSAALKDTLAKADADALDKMKADGVTVVTWSKEEVAKLRGFTSAVQDDLAGKNANAKAVVDSLRAFQKKVG